MGHNPLNNGLSSGKNNGSAQLADNYPDFPVTAKLMDDRSLVLSRHGFPDGSGKTMPFSELMETLHGGGGGDGGERVGAGVGGGGFKNPPPSATFANIKISSSIIKNSVNAGLHLNSTTSSTTNSVTSINAGSSASASAAASAAAATGTICKSALTGGTDRCIASTLMDAFKKSLTFNDCGFPTLDLPKNDMCLSELVLKYEKKKKPGASSSSSRKTNSTSTSSSSSSALHKTFCIACTTREVVPQVKPSNDFFGYLSELLCTPCISKLKKTKAVSEIEASEKKRETEKKKKEKESAANEEKLLPELQLLKEKMGAQNSLFKNKRSGGRAMGVTVDEELNGCWMEIRNAIYQVFLEEGFTLNPVVEAYISPGLCRYCLPPTSMLRAMVKRLYHAHQHKFFLLTVCHVQLFIMEIKLTLLRELVHLEKRPYFIFAVFYSLFQRLLRALRRTNRFLDLIEEEFLKKNALYWLQIHFLFFQTFVYMNRFIQKSISLLCDCSTENGLHTEDSEEGRLVGKIVYRSYIILEQSMASFSMCTNASSASFAAFFTKFDDVSTELGESSTSGLSSGMNGSCMEGGSSSQKLSSIRKGREAGKKRGRELGKRGGGGGSGSSHPAAAAVLSELPMYPVFHLQTLVNITLSHLLFDHYHPASIASPLTSGDCSVQFQMLFQFAILLFNCKNYDENIFAKRFLATDYAVKSLQAMPGLPAELMAVDGLNTVAFQLFLVIHHWDSTEVFDNVMRRLPTVECSRSSRSIIKTILTESFNEVGYEERKLLADFYAMMDVPMPTSSGGEAHEAAAVASFDSLLAQEIALSDEEAYDEEGLGGSYDALDYDEAGNCLEAIHHHHHAHHGGHGHGHAHHSHHGGGGGGPAGHGGFGSCYPPHDCDCYADIFGDPAAAVGGATGGGHHGGAHSSLFPPVPPPAPPSRRSALEVRERLRQKISTRKQRVNQLVENCNAAATALATAHANNETAPSDPASFTAGAGAEAVIDDRKIDDLLSFINGGDENEEGGGGNKKRKSKAKKKTKQSKKQKNKEDSSGGNGNGNGKKNGQTSLEKAKLPKQKPTPSISKVDDEEELEEELEDEEEEEEEEEVVELLSSVEVKQEKEEVRKEERAKPSPKVNGHAKTTAAANKPLPPKSTFSSDKAKTKAKTKTSAPISRTATPPPPPPLTKAVISNGGAQTNGLDDGDGDNEEEEGDEEGEEDDDLQEEKEEEEFSDEENNKHLASEESSSSDEQQLVELNISNPEEVFMPTDIDLDSEDIDDFEKDLERFKRFCYDTICGYTLDSCKLKLAINVKEIFSRGAAATKPSTTAHNSNNACFAASSVGGAPQ